MNNIQLKDARQQNLYPITKSGNVQFNDGKNLDEKLANIKTTVTWNEIEGKPNTFTPSEHTHEFVKDQVISNETTWSSNKISSAINTKAEINDGNESNQFTWSGEFIANNYSHYTHTHSEYAKSSHTHPASEITGTISKSNLPVAFGDREQIGICYLDDNPNNSWHTYEAVGAHASAVKQVYDKVVTAQAKADSAYNLANHSHPYLSSSSLSSSTSSTSTTTPANAYAVKLAYDRGTAAYNLANHSHPYASSTYFSGGSSISKLTNSYSTSNYVQVYGGSEVELRAGSARAYLSNYGAWSFYPANSTMDLGGSTTSSRWRYIYAQSAVNTSDKKYKENIQYLDEVSTFASNNDNNPFLNFIKNDFRPATYNYIAQRKDEEPVAADKQIGFVANDIYNTEVGKTFLYNFGTEEETDLMFSPAGYTTVVAKALQEEIKVREEEIKLLKEQLELTQERIVALELKIGK